MSQDPQDAVRKAIGTQLKKTLPIRVRLSNAYRLGIVLTAALMPLIPLLYAAGIVGLGALLILEVGENLPVYQSLYGHLALPLWIITLVLGVAILILLLKPFLTRYPKPKGQVVLDKGSEPVLENLISSICEMVNAPVPEEIVLTLKPECRMELVPGIFSMFRTRTRLYIGLPMFACLNLEEITGVLTRRIGLFTRGSALRLRLLILVILRWFERATRDKDNWDLRLEKKSKQSSGLRKLNIWITRTCIWLSRRVLWILMIIGQWISFPVMRHRVYDADDYACRIIGTKDYKDILQGKALLKFSHDKALHYYRENQSTGTLPADFANMVKYFYDRLSSQEKQQAEAATAKRRTHPSRKMRFRHMENEAHEGFFNSQLPAATLFINLEEVSEELTQIQLSGILGMTPGPVVLKPNSQLLALDLQREASLRFVEKFLGASFNFTVHWNLDKRSASNLSLRRDDTHFIDLSEWKDMLRQEVEKAQVIMGADIPALDMEITKVQQYRTLLEVKWDAFARSLNNDKPVSEDLLQSRLKELENQRNALISKLQPLQQTGSQFLNEMAREFVKRKVPQQRKEEYRNLWYILVAQNNLGPLYRRCRQKQSALHTLIQRIHQMEEQNISFEIGYPLRFARGLEKDLEELTIYFGGLPYPFEGTSSTVRAYLTEKPDTQEEEIVRIYRFSESCLNRFFTLYNRVAGTMLQACFEDPYPPIPDDNDEDEPSSPPSAPQKPKLKL